MSYLEEELPEKITAEIEEEPITEKVPKTRVSRRQVASELQVSARQFIRMKKLRWEQAAGFLHDMRQRFPNRIKTRTDWDQLWTDFINRSVKSC